ncbi:hypothetical protein BO71DRAFT_402657 [Aspergillus ellipticus CBS 707.79]|uniref:Uncharacterized protein n=1 Tax=Aspergillus ellipticus CBS 707.79 TaxID=1448320 RepID=A0A319DFZ4_9EURO|nr:hypothetical protein BO71DRAFT_402657 [Aspergillus ellipticus CBS 707.79]
MGKNKKSSKKKNNNNNNKQRLPVNDNQSSKEQLPSPDPAPEGAVEVSEDGATPDPVCTASQV